MQDRAQLDVRQLRALLAVVEHGSLSRAAVALQLAQSTMSETIASLDRAVGTPVLARRRGHRLQLTEAGCTLLPYAKTVMRELQEAQQAVSRVAAQARSHVDVFTVESLSTYLLPGILAQARKRWPNTRFAVTVAPCATIRDAAAEGQCDLGLMLEERPSARAFTSDAAQAAEVVGEVPLVVFGSPSHVLAQRRRPAVRLDALSPYLVFVSDGAGAYYNLLARYLTTGRLPGPRVEASGSVEATRVAVLADPAALGILPAYAIAAQLRTGRAVALCVNPPPPVMRVVAYLPDRGLHPVVRTLVDGARQALAAGNSATLPASA
jgi:DNA-binding transcriptional LysR family regulator